MDWIGKVRLKWRWSLAWAAVIGSGIMLEVFALLPSSGQGDTLSENVWWLVGGHPAVWWVGAALFIWAGRHFFFRRR